MNGRNIVPTVMHKGILHDNGEVLVQEFNNRGHEQENCIQTVCDKLSCKQLVIGVVQCDYLCKIRIKISIA